MNNNQGKYDPDYDEKGSLEHSVVGGPSADSGQPSDQVAYIDQSAAHTNETPLESLNNFLSGKRSVDASCEDRTRKIKAKAGDGPPDDGGINPSHQATYADRDRFGNTAGISFAPQAGTEAPISNFINQEGGQSGGLLPDVAAAIRNTFPSGLPSNFTQHNYSAIQVPSNSFQNQTQAPAHHSSMVFAGMSHPQQEYNAMISQQATQPPQVQSSNVNFGYQTMGQHTVQPVAANVCAPNFQQQLHLLMQSTLAAASPGPAPPPPPPPQPTDPTAMLLGQILSQGLTYDPAFSQLLAQLSQNAPPSVALQTPQQASFQLNNAFQQPRQVSQPPPPMNNYVLPHAAPAALQPRNNTGITLSLAYDNEQLSEYQILVRKQLELFQALREDVDSNTQGRKKQVFLSQVGLRCKHCAHLPLRQRSRGAVYYPSALKGVYQAAQNMACSHLCESCHCIGDDLKQELRDLRDRRNTASGGKQYWADGCRAMGLYECEGGLKLRIPAAEAADTDELKGS